MAACTLLFNGTPVWSGSWTGCKDEARKIGKSNGELKFFQVAQSCTGAVLQECHYEPGKQLKWLTPARQNRTMPDLTRREMLLPRGTRVRFLRDFAGDYGFKAIQGQTATVRMAHSSVVVELDGWEAEKLAEADYTRRMAECHNVVPWIGTVPLDVLEVVT